MRFLELFNERLDFGSEVQDLLDQGMIPILPKMMNDLGYAEDDIEAYHMTNTNDIPDKITRKSQLSTFTKPSLELTKLPSNPDIVLKVKGRMLLKGSSDIYTYLDVNGRRWIKLDYRRENMTKESKQLHFMIKSISKSNSGMEYYRKLVQYLDDGGYKLLNIHLKTVTFKYNELVLDRVQVLGYYSLNSSDKNIKYKYLGDLSTRDFMNL